MTTIISGFPGIGKTHYHNCDGGSTLDSDSSKFSWIEDGVRHPDFPQNYIDHIKDNLDKVDFIFVSSHQNVRDALVANELRFVLVFPDPGLKEEYIQRYRDRGNEDGFVKLLEENWELFMFGLENQKGCNIIKLKSGEYLSDYLEWQRR